MWEQQQVGANAGGQDEDSDVEMTDANRASAFVIEVSSDDLSSSADDDDRSEREGSESTSVESWSEDEFKAGTQSKARQSFKRKAPWMVPNPRQPWLTQGRSQSKRRRL